MTEKIVLDREDMRRTLVRIAHEIVERTGGEDVAVVGIHRRGAVLAARLHDLVAELVGEPVPLGDIDISFYRDDLGLRDRPRSRSCTPRTSTSRVEDATVVLVDDVLYTGRTVRAAIDALFDYGRPRRVQLAVLADRGHRELPIRPDYVGKNLPTARGERVNVRVEELDGVDEVTISMSRRQRRTAWPRRRTWHEPPPALDRRPHARRHRAHPRPRRELRRGLRARDQEGADPARPHRHQPLLRVLHAHQLVSFELAAKRLSAPTS